MLNPPTSLRGDVASYKTKSRDVDRNHSRIRHAQVISSGNPGMCREVSHQSLGAAVLLSTMISVGVLRTAGLAMCSGFLTD